MLSSFDVWQFVFLDKINFLMTNNFCDVVLSLITWKLFKFCCLTIFGNIDGALLIFGSKICFLICFLICDICGCNFLFELIDNWFVKITFLWFSIGGFIIVIGVDICCGIIGIILEVSAPFSV